MFWNDEDDTDHPGLRLPRRPLAIALAVVVTSLLVNLSFLAWEIGTNHVGSPVFVAQLVLGVVQLVASDLLVVNFMRFI